MTKRLSPRTRSVSLVAAVTATLALTACQTNLDMQKTQSAIKTGLSDQLKLPIASVSCPEDRAIKAGDVFECTATAETGGDLNIQVTQKDDAGNITWELTNGDSVLSLASLEKQIKAGILQQLSVDAAIDCPGEMRVSQPGKTFECTAKSASDSRQVVVTMTDAKGNVSWALK